jgi:PleD family two-component response regulator
MAYRLVSPKDCASLSRAVLACSVSQRASIHCTSGSRSSLPLLGFVVETREMEPLLLVEDKNELRAMLRKALERAGYAVEEAPDGTTAIQKVRARRYLMVITDLKMPGASGLDVLRESKPCRR